MKEFIIYYVTFIFIINLSVLFYNIVATIKNKTVFSLKHILIFNLFLSFPCIFSVLTSFEIDITTELLYNTYIPRVIISLIAFFFIKSINFLIKYPKLAITILLAEILLFIYHILIPKMHYISFMDSIFFFLTLYSGWFLINKFLQPMMAKKEFEYNMELKYVADKIYDEIYKNPFLNKLFFFRNYSIMVFCNMNFNNPFSYIIYSVIGIIILPYLVYKAQYLECFYIALFLSVLLFLNEMLLNKYKNNKKFYDNFNRNATDLSKGLFMITRQTNPITIKVIKRNMVKIAIDGVGFVESGPIPYKTAKMLALTAVVLGFAAGTVHVIDSNNNVKIRLAECATESDKYKADSDKYKADSDKAKADSDKAKADSDKAKAEITKYEAKKIKYQFNAAQGERKGKGFFGKWFW